MLFQNFKMVSFPEFPFYLGNSAQYNSSIQYPIFYGYNFSLWMDCLIVDHSYRLKKCCHLNNSFIHKYHSPSSAWSIVNIYRSSIAFQIEKPYPFNLKMSSLMVLIKIKKSHWVSRNHFISCLLLWHPTS